MELLRWKTRLAVLWIILAVGFSAYMFLRFMEPGFIEGIISGQFGRNQSQITGRYLFYLAIFWFIPFIMAWLYLTLKSSANRWTNFVLGVILVITFVYGLVESATRGHSAAGDVHLKADNGSTVQLDGSANDLRCEVGGSSLVKLEGFSVRNADVKLSGESTATVRLDGKLDVELKKGSRLTYYGNPVLGTTQISGGSTMTRK